MPQADCRRTGRLHRCVGKCAGGSREILVSTTVKNLLIGSGIEFVDRGEHDLKGVPGSCRLFAVVG
jgi:hypothetical protein